MKLKVIHTQEHDPHKNLAYEEELKKLISADEYLLRFWINNPVLVMGRFQKEEYEAQEDYLKSESIPLIRRSTGGGTVYHDRGTLNVSFCKPKLPNLRTGEKDSTIIVNWIARALSNLGFHVRQDTRNALFIGEKKILGSAVSLTDEILLFHCSILVHTNLSHLEKAINWTPRYQDGPENFVKSHRSPVINLKDINLAITIPRIAEEIEKVINNELMRKK